MIEELSNEKQIQNSLNILEKEMEALYIAASDIGSKLIPVRIMTTTDETQPLKLANDEVGVFRCPIEERIDNIYEKARITRDFLYEVYSSLRI
jgi:hypothetical protein